MDLNENFVVTSKFGTGSVFPANFAGAIRVQDGHKLALKNIAYGKIFNVTSGNNLLLLEHVTDKAQQLIELEVEPGCYPSALSLTQMIEVTINNWINSTNAFCATLGVGFHPVKVSYDIKTDIIKFDTSGHDHLILTKDERPNVLDLMDFWNVTPKDKFQLKGFTIKNYYFSNNFPAFVYGSVVENSFIDGQPSRLLAVIPIQSGFDNSSETGYHFYQFSSPTYYNFGIREFSQIMFYILDGNGKPVEFDPDYETILNLEVFKPLNISM